MWKQWQSLYVLGSNITADGDCHEIKRCLLLGKKVVINLDSISKSRDITLPTKFRLVKAMVLPVVMYKCESWTTKKAEHGRIDAFELWCWRRLLRVSWTAARSNQSILKEISPECSSEGLMLKLKLQYFGHLMWRADSFEKTLMLGKIKGRRKRGQQRMWWLDGITNTMDMSWVNSRSWRCTGRPGVLQSMGLQRVDWSTELNWCKEMNHWKNPGAGKGWRQKKWVTEDAMAGWHHQCNGHELGQTLEDSERQGSLVYCSPMESGRGDTTWQLSNNKKIDWYGRGIFD